MSSENLLEVRRDLHESQVKYAYYLLAIAASGIAYAVHTTSSAKLSWEVAPLGVAVLLWGASFFSGCRYVDSRSMSLFVNATLLKMQSGTHEMTGMHPDKIAIGVDVAREHLELNNGKQKFWCSWQFRFLVLGAIAFVAWRVFSMWANTIRGF